MSFDSQTPRPPHGRHRKDRHGVRRWGALDAVALLPRMPLVEHGVVLGKLTGQIVEPLGPFHHRLDLDGSLAADPEQPTRAPAALGDGVDSDLRRRHASGARHGVDEGRADSAVIRIEAVESSIERDHSSNALGVGADVALNAAALE